MAMLVLLMAGTSWAVASWVSPWFVPFYLILMAWLLFPQSGRPSGSPIAEEPGESNRLLPVTPVEDLDEPDSTDDGPALAEPSDSGLEPGNLASASKARRGKSRSKKNRSIAEPTEATWVQVAPGKFVRVEASEESSPAGPHARVVEPVAVPTTTTPQQRWEFEEGDALDRPEDRRTADAPPGVEAARWPERPPEEIAVLGDPLEEVQPAFETIESRDDDDRIVEVESVAGKVAEVVDQTGLPGIVARPSAADGIAPQSEVESGERIDEQRPATMMAALPDHQVEGNRVFEGWTEEFERSSLPEDPALTETSTLARPDVLSEARIAWKATDPTETAVDETVLDDAGPFDVDPHDFNASTDADFSGPEVAIDPSRGSNWWPWRIASRAWTRVGQPPLRAVDRDSAPRRLVRSLRPPRQPPDPRRPSRRGLGRPRQITRRLPPRSPPSWRYWLGWVGLV